MRYLALYLIVMCMLITLALFINHLFNNIYGGIS